MLKIHNNQILLTLGFLTLMYAQVNYTSKPNVEYSFARYYKVSFQIFEVRY